MKLWIVGARGLLGSALTVLCQTRAVPFVATGHEIVDITRLDQLKKFSHSKEAFGITHIINCAAFTDVDRSEKEPEIAHLVNAIGPENIGTVANEMGAGVVHISTDYVFSGLQTQPYLETDFCDPISTYGKTKLEGEKNLLDVSSRACIIRSSWLFGKGGKNFISSMLDRMKKETRLHVVSDQRGRPTFVGDLAETILSLLCHSGVYHFANDGAVSRFEMAEKMKECALKERWSLLCNELIPVPSTTFPTAAKRPAYSVLNTQKIESVLGTPPRHWEKALKEFLRHAF